MCFLKLPEVQDDEPFADRHENIIMYQNSQGHDLMAAVTDKQSIFVYSLAEMRERYFKRQQKVDKDNLKEVKEHQDPL